MSIMKLPKYLTHYEFRGVLTPMPVKNKKHFDRIPDKAYYFSVDIQENRPHYSVMVPGMNSVAQIEESYGDRHLFEVLGDGANLFQFECELCDLLKRAEENRADRVFLSLTFYDECLEVVADYEGVSNNGYYCIDLDMDMRNAVRDFIRCVAEGKQLERIAKPLPCEPNK